mmetsp:Transcript_17376/g.34864  ORF Transcript_17376/g.34864 Transcript_17376/m.34864 type:complete len:302 (+) Transcript_17376:265-1170(+)
MASSARSQESSLPSGWAFHRIPCTSVDIIDELSMLRGAFDEDGFICLSSVFDTVTVNRLREAATTNFDECFRRLHECGHTNFPQYCQEQDGRHEYALKVGIKAGFREIVMRSPGRFEMPYGCNKSPFADDDIVRNKDLLQVVCALLSDDKNIRHQDSADDSFYLCNASIVTATPGSANQGWHADGGHINLQSHEPCHCFNVFIPLVDVSLPLGPTELRPGSHKITRNLAPMMLAAKARGTLRKPVMPLLRAGDALIFDYRVLHRGRANITKESDRPILVMTFAKSGFKDRLNFPSKSIDDR